MGILLVYDVTDERSFNSMLHSYVSQWHIHNITDIRNWHTNIEQHASEGVNKILIGNKSDWTDKKAVTEEQGRVLADEFGIKFMETSAKVNEGVEEAFFTLARSDFTIDSEMLFDICFCHFFFRDIKARLIDSQAEAGVSTGGASTSEGSVKVNQPSNQSQPGCCS